MQCPHNFHHVHVNININTLRIILTPHGVKFVLYFLEYADNRHTNNVEYTSIDIFIEVNRP